MDKSTTLSRLFSGDKVIKRKFQNIEICGTSEQGLIALLPGHQNKKARK